MKTCKYCHMPKPLGRYRHNSLMCKDCANQDKKAWVKNNWEAVNESNKAYNKKVAHVIRGNKLTKYWPGTTWEEATAKYEALLIKQNKVCAICRREEKRVHKKTGTKWDLAVDHCHDTNEVRGLLCNACNRGLGLLGDNLTSLSKVVDYLKLEA